MNFKRIITTIIAVTIVAGSLVGCGKKEVSSNLIKVGVCAGPYGDMFKEAIAPSLEEKGYTVEIIEFSDYVQPNNSLAEGEIDVNLFQHSIYLNNFTKEHSLEITAIAEVPTAAMGVFSQSNISLNDAKDGANVAIPNDDTNLSRALRVLAQSGVITLNSEIDASKASVADIVENPHNLQFTEVSAEILPSILDSTDYAVITGNYAIGAGLNLADAVYNEQLAEGYFNVIAVKTADLEAEFTKDIKDIVYSDAFRSIIEDENHQYVAFSKPSAYNQ